jgi:hypothetical protein
MDRLHLIVAKVGSISATRVGSFIFCLLPISENQKFTFLDTLLNNRPLIPGASPSTHATSSPFLVRSVV